MHSERQNPWVNFEAGAGWILKLLVIPVCYGNMDKGSMPKSYSSFQAVNIPADEWYLVNSVAHHLGVAEPPLKSLADALLKKKGPWDALAETLRPNLVQLPLRWATTQGLICKRRTLGIGSHRVSVTASAAMKECVPCPAQRGYRGSDGALTIAAMSEDQE